MNAATQTETDLGRVKKSNLPKGAMERGSMAERRKLHRGVNSPGYNHGSIISIDGEGGLWRRYGTGGDGFHRGGTGGMESAPMPEGRAPHGHMRINVQRQATPEVTGWATKPPATIKDPLAGGKRKKGGRGREIKPGYAGNRTGIERRTREGREKEERRRQELMALAGML